VLITEVTQVTIPNSWVLTFAVTYFSGSTPAFKMVTIRLEKIVNTFAPDCWQNIVRKIATTVDFQNLGPQIERQ